MAEHFVERRWESTSALSKLLRIMLMPLSWLYLTVVLLRNVGYNRGWIRSYKLPLPTVSIGNLTVGGTGKTPIAAWLAARLVALGAHPAILLRGYGADEPLVHKLLVPNAMVFSGADRVASAAEARRRGATVLVLDDAFQHRRARRDADVVILSADRHRTIRMLPAGPWREPEQSLRRATHIIIVRKRSSPLRAREVAEYAAGVAPAAKMSIVHLGADALVRWGGAERRPLTVLASKVVLAISAIGDPRAFEGQLRETGARTAPRTFPDHHAFSRKEVQRLAHEATGADFTVCTLKDAVKLGPVWPPSAPPLWYLSQTVSIELGAESLDGLARSLAALAHD